MDLRLRGDDEWGWEVIVSRRAFIGSSLAAGLALPARAEQAGLADIAQGVSPTLVQQALLALDRHHGAIWSRDVIAIADFALPSSRPRFHLIDILAGKTTSFRVAHGKGSDPDHSGFLQSFSNMVGSLATSEGAYLTGEPYEGVHGASRRLIGLDANNSNAVDRAIVIHGAWYAGGEVVARQGVMGRSDGCFVFSPADIGIILARLGRGRLIYAGRGGQA